MKAGIHPEYELRMIHCGSCGAEWSTRTTMTPNHSDGRVHIEVCSNCHPFFTGKQKLMDKAGRVERFRRRYAKPGDEKAATGEEATEATEEKAATS